MGKRDFRAWKKFLRNRLALAGLVFITVTLFCSIFAVLLSPDPSPNANRIQLPLTAKKPGFDVYLLRVPKARVEEGKWSDMFTGREVTADEMPVLDWHLKGDSVFFREYYEDSTLAIERALPLSRFPEHASFEKEYIHKTTFWLGTDRFGRDMLSRMLLGARISLSVGFVAVFISMFIGILLGAIAAYFGGWQDKVIQWLMNVIWSLPTLLLVIAFSLALGKGFWQIFIAVGLSMWVDVARMVRGQVLSLKEKEFVEAAKVLGVPDSRVLFRHILPNLIGPLTVVAAANFASAILLEAGLSFLGLGVQAPIPSWGQMIKEHYGYIVLDSAYLAIVPGLAIMLLVMSFNFVGNGLRDALDVKLK